ncbi:hypothetical protein B0H11DRAFT_2268899 [Mycena galericulata]|nr:hypothetical protein B0H11DRAFT_2268899 [Mycena galericulata]
MMDVGWKRSSPKLSNASKALVTSASAGKAWRNASCALSLKPLHGPPSGLKAPYRRASSLSPPRKYPECPFQALPSRLRDGLKISQVPKSSRRLLLFPAIPLPSPLSALIPSYLPPPLPPLPLLPLPLHPRTVYPLAPIGRAPSWARCLDRRRI